VGEQTPRTSTMRKEFSAQKALERATAFENGRGSVRTGKSAGVKPSCQGKAAGAIRGWPMDHDGRERDAVPEDDEADRLALPGLQIVVQRFDGVEGWPSTV